MRKTGSSKRGRRCWITTAPIYGLTPVMSIDYVKEIINLAGVTNPLETPVLADWLQAEADIGLVFPEDFKTLVTALGTGSFGVGIYYRNPVASSEYVLLSRAALIRYREPISDLELSGTVRLYPSKLGLVNIASMDRQDFLLRPDRSGKHLSDLVWLDVETRQMRDLNVSFCQFMHDLYFEKVPGKWAKELREYFWPSSSVAFFTPWKK